jgi:membrane protein DedA with SNARE-associated domain
MLFGSFIQYLSHLSYFGVFAYAGTIGYIVPVPEEAAFIILGYLAGIAKFKFGYVFIAAAGGILAADQFFYAIAYYESRYLLKFKNKIKEDLWRRYERAMVGNIGKTMIVSRFLVGFRFLGPVIAGSLKIPYRKFLIYDLTIVGMYIAGLMYVGYFLRHRALRLLNFIEQFHNAILWGVVIALVFTLVRLARARTVDRA